MTNEELYAALRLMLECDETNEGIELLMHLAEHLSIGEIVTVEEDLVGDIVLTFPREMLEGAS